MEYLLIKPPELFTDDETQTFLKTANFMVEQFKAEVERLKALEKDFSVDQQTLTDQASICVMMEKDLVPFLQKAEELLAHKTSLNGFTTH